MDSRTYAVNVNESIAAIIRILVQHGITGVPVVNDAGAVAGMVTEAECLRLITHGGPTGMPPEGTAAEWMTTDVPSVSPDMDIYYVAGLFNKHPMTRRFPVVEDGKLVGVVTRKDVLRAAQQLLESSS
jgi:CBS domain-containing protein